MSIYDTRSPAVHDVKSWSAFYWPIKRGAKKHDLRVNDRKYQVGDSLLLREYDMANGRYTGESCTAKITFITDRQHPCAFSGAVLQRDYCILSLDVDANVPDR